MRKKKKRYPSRKVILGAVPPLSAGAVIKAVELKAAGHCELDGERLEFVDVRLYVLP